MTRLLVVASPVYSAGGGLRHALAFARAAADLDWDVTVLVASRGGDSGLHDLVRSVVPNAAIRIHDGGPAASLSWTCLELLKWIRHGGAIYAPFPQSMLLGYVFARAFPRRTRLILGFVGTPIPEAVRPWKQRIYRPALAHVIADNRVELTAVSHAQLGEAFEMLGGRPRGSVIGNVAHSVGDAPWVERRSWLPRPNHNTVAVLARLSWEKGVDIAIRALTHIESDVTLKIGGDGPERAALEKLAHDLDLDSRIQFVGWCDSRELLEEASVVVIPSRRDGLPASLLEAAWARVPIVAAAVGGIPEIADRLDATELVPPDDEHALAKAIDRGLTAPRPEDDPPVNWQDFAGRVREVLRRCA